MKNINVSEHISTSGFWFWCFTLRYTVDDPSQKTVPPRKLIIFQFREMIFLPDLSDGETSDNMANVEEDEDDDEVVLNSNPGFNR